MIIAALGLAAFGLYFLIMGDGPARFAGVLMLLVACILGFLFWVALYVERPPAESRLPIFEVHHV